MQHFRLVIHISVFILLVVVSSNFIFNPLESNTMVTFSNHAENIIKRNDPIYEDIKSKKEDYEEKPQDAVIDDVWKKIPGRNGLKVNVDKSYENMKEHGSFNEELLVYDQITPDVTLDDLPPSPIYRGHSDKDMVALMFNVSWGSDYIPDILNTLKEHNVKATFFIEGQWAAEHKEYVEMIKDQDHLIGNHAYDHPVMSRLSQEKIAKQIEQTNDILDAITGKTPQLFAPPSGDYNDLVVDTAAERDMQTILWTVDTIDWKNPSVSVMVNRVEKNIHPGAMVLMHPTSSVAKGLDPLLKQIEKDDYEMGTVETLLSHER